MSYESHQATRSWAWLVGSRQYTNLTYELTTENVVEMAWFVAAVAGLGFDESFEYIEELHNDQALLDRLRRAAAAQHVVETGVDKGLGSCGSAAALLRNADKGHHGRLTALDINRDADAPIGGKYASVIDLRYGDSIAMLAPSASPVDLFLHDSDHHYDHESAEYRAVAGSLTESALVMTDHDGLALGDFAKSGGRRFLILREDPADHWAPGGVLGVAMHVAT
jgi:hypothetical protein